MALNVGVSLQVRAERLIPLSLYILGISLLLGGLRGIILADDIIIEVGTGEGGGSFNDEKIVQAVCDLFNLIEGSFGALLTTVAGIAAIISASMGAYRAAVSMLFTGCGAFILRSLVSLYFAEVTCDGAGFIPEP